MSDEYAVIVPLSDLIELQRAAQGKHDYAVELGQIRREIEGLRFMFRELLQTFSDFKKEIKR